jgi:hypothetical protein
VGVGKAAFPVMPGADVTNDIADRISVKQDRNLALGAELLHGRLGGACLAGRAEAGYPDHMGHPAN